MHVGFHEERIINTLAPRLYDSQIRQPLRRPAIARSRIHFLTRSELSVWFKLLTEALFTAYLSLKSLGNEMIPAILSC